MHELDGKDEIFQLPDETDSLVLPLQGRRGICEMAEGGEGGSWELPLQGRYEVVGDDGYARELESSLIQETDGSSIAPCCQELESSVKAKDESTVPVSAGKLESLVQDRDGPSRAEGAEGLMATAGELVTDSIDVHASTSHFMWRQQQRSSVDGSATADPRSTNEA